MSKFKQNNSVVFCGEISSDFEYSHEMFGEKFYSAKLYVERLSGEIDVLPIVVSERLVDVEEDWRGQFVKISGQIRTYDKCKNKKRNLIVFIFVMEFEVLESLEEPINEVCIDGYLCKKASYKKTPFGREISYIMLAINRGYGKKYYIPCIAWGRNAIFSTTIPVGCRIKVIGRMQSRDYAKTLKDGTRETKTAYEVSISKMEIKEEKEDF